MQQNIAAAADSDSFEGLDSKMIEQGKHVSRSLVVTEGLAGLGGASVAAHVRDDELKIRTQVLDRCRPILTAAAEAVEQEQGFAIPVEFEVDLYAIESFNAPFHFASKNKTAHAQRGRWFRLRTSLSRIELFCLCERNHKQHGQKQVYSSQTQVRGMHAMLQVKHDDGDAKAEFFQNGRDHHRAQTHWIVGNEYKCNLPGQRHSSKAVIEPGMGDRGRILLADLVKNEIQRRNCHQAINSGDPKNDFGKFHKRLQLRQ